MALEGTAYFSLSTSEGHRDGRILVAQSSSLYRSEVAASARSAAFRAWTNGSLKERVNAAVRTFCRVYRILARDGTAEVQRDVHWHQDFAPICPSRWLYLCEYLAAHRLRSLQGA